MPFRRAHIRKRRFAQFRRICVSAAWTVLCLVRVRKSIAASPLRVLSGTLALARRKRAMTLCLLNLLNPNGIVVVAVDGAVAAVGGGERGAVAVERHTLLHRLSVARKPARVSFSALHVSTWARVS